MNLVSSVQKNNTLIPFKSISNSVSKVPCVQCSNDIQLITNAVYEYQKGIRPLFLFSEKKGNQSRVESFLTRKKVPYVIHELSDKKINVYLGSPSCLKVVETLNPRLRSLSAEQDFILGAMLGYNIEQECDRYLMLKQKEKKLNLIG